jgi:hypothetical protein
MLTIHIAITILTIAPVIITSLITKPAMVIEDGHGH